MGVASRGRERAKQVKEQLLDIERQSQRVEVKEHLARACEADLINPDLHWYAVETFPHVELQTVRRLVGASRKDWADRPGDAPLTNFWSYVSGEPMQIYIPVDNFRMVIRRQTVERMVTTFPGYLFVGLEKGAVLYHRVFGVEGVRDAVGGWMTPERVPGVRLQAGERELAGDGRRPEPRLKFVQGSVVRIMEGPFLTFPGVVEGEDARGDFHILASIFGRQTRLTLPASHLAPA